MPGVLCHPSSVVPLKSETGSAAVAMPAASKKVYAWSFMGKCDREWFAGSESLTGL